MADEQLPTVEIAPTVIISNSDDGNDNASNNENVSSDNGASGDNSGSDSVEDTPSELPENVTIAAIEADRDIALAEIHSAVERERIELEADRIETIEETNREFEECQREIAELRERIAELTLLILPPVLETVPEEQLEIVPEPNLTEPSTVVPTIETMTELSEENADEKPEAEIPNPGRRFIAI
jgi:hypothetical protein